MDSREILTDGHAIASHAGQFAGIHADGAAARAFERDRQPQAGVFAAGLDQAATHAPGGAANGDVQHAIPLWLRR
ncbi:MAG: hypothetical protein A2150_03060 [Candidatus Muproteobacteria bacterium RBG_16_64_11]|uniref:Uncharacterized protein n=1 Tax=Candidatus Muproteobacteria bacterium RBG_16_64_11 TaxID=1817758 RepID=A0A1F6TFU2_9PROT|nr:MAG: hypothetical protein A2150_03060 [Candidatus Muproteobacteria bacterium RBG_16_64_11]